MRKSAITASKSTTCKNCGYVFQGNFCNNCGQDSHVGKLDGHFLMHELEHGLFHVDKGILFTIKELFSQPGIFLRKYIEGKRAGHFKPFAFLVILSGIYAFAAHYSNEANLISYVSAKQI